jgi:hypothetical protein
MRSTSRTDRTPIAPTSVPLCASAADKLPLLDQIYMRDRNRPARAQPELVKTNIFLRRPEQSRGRLVLQICDDGDRYARLDHNLRSAKKAGLPYLVVTFAPEGMKIATANSKLGARTIASERAIRRRSERQSEQAKVVPAMPTRP